MSRTSVFGSSGFIGNRFCQMFPADSERIGRDFRTPYSPNILYLISTIDNYNVHKDLHVDIDTNLTVLMEVLDAIKGTTFEEPPVINFVSSWFVYGQNNEIPFREDFSQCNPTGFYSITKRCAEQMLICWCNTFGYKYRIFRLANVLGEGDGKISRKKNALQHFVKEIVHNRDVELYYGGDVLRDYIYVDDVCTAMKLCMDKAPVNQIYNIGSGIPLRFLDIINKTIEYAGSASKIVQIEPTNFHNIVQVRHSYLDTTKLKGLGFTQQYDIDATLKRLITHYRNGN